ncbi:hypothetical protein [Streptomyces sp. NPDC001500]
MTPAPRMLLVLSENCTLTGGRADLPAAVRWAREAEDAGFRLRHRQRPHRFIDDPVGVGAFCREVMRRVEALTD